MENPTWISQSLIGVETPTFLLVFLDCFGNVFMMTNLHTLPKNLSGVTSVNGQKHDAQSNKDKGNEGGHCPSFEKS